MHRIIRTVELWVWNSSMHVIENLMVSVCPISTLRTTLQHIHDSSEVCGDFLRGLSFGSNRGRHFDTFPLASIRHTTCSPSVTGFPHFPICCKTTFYHRILLPHRWLLDSAESYLDFVRAMSGNLTFVSIHRG